LSRHLTASVPPPALELSARRRARRASAAAFGLAAAAALVVGGGTAQAGTAQAPTAAPNVGLFGAQDPTFDGVYRQSLSIIGLRMTNHIPDAAAVGWLLGQQCADGSFTAYRANPATACTAASEDENATALAVQALVVLAQPEPATAAVAALRHFQLADGGFYDNTAFGPPASDVNSTGLALSAFAAAGVDHASVTSGGKSGIDYLRTLQISCATAAGAGAYDFQTEATLHANDYATVQGLLGVLGKSLPVNPVHAFGATPTCPATVTDAASSAAAATSYISARLIATNGAIPSAFGSGTDWTTTASAVLDLEAAEVGRPAINAGLAALQANVLAYTKTAGVFTPGPLATLALVADATATDGANFGGVNLATALAATERTAPVAAPAPATPAAPTLPATGGAGLLPLGLTGGALVALGLAAVAASRRRLATTETRSP